MTAIDRPASATDDAAINGAQADGVLDMDVVAFRAAAHDAVDVMADYLEAIERYAVFPNVEPGSIAPQPRVAARTGRADGAILSDYQRLVEPNATAWQHPGFMAYFSDDGVGPGDHRRDAHGGHRPERHALANVADRDGAGGRRRRPAPPCSACPRPSTAC